MADAPIAQVTEFLHRIAAPLATMTDAELLARFAAQRDEEAFAHLLRRHGPMVLGVCRRALGPTPDADDAFQATFVALARDAGRVSDNLSGWLFRVAVRSSRRALRRSDRAVASADRVDPADDLSRVEWREVRRLLDDELNRLPDRWRSPLVLCYLDGLTRDEAARRLGWSLRTLHRRLDEGRQRLKARLTRRGLGPAVLATAVLAGNDLRADVPAPLLRTTAELVGRGATVPTAIRVLIPNLTPIGGLAMKALLSAVLLVGVLVMTMGERQPTRADPQPRPVPPDVLALAPVVKDKPPKDPLAEKVQRAQEDGIKYLKDQLKDQGGGRWSWEDAVLAQLQKGGPSALATLALLECGLKADDVAVARGLDFLRTVEPANTYVVGLQTQVFCKANQKDDADRIKRNVAWLEKAAAWNGANLLGWSYTGDAGGRADNSNTRYAIAGLYAADRAGFKVKRDAFWPAVRDLYVRTQHADGGWGYIAGPSKPTHTMTGSGLLCLTLAAERIDKDDKATEAARNGGYGWMANNFRLQSAPHTFYNFDVVAALGRASEKKDFGTAGNKVEWYRLGAEWLLKEQKANGSWLLNDALDKYPVVSTAFALRFLASRPE